MHERKCLQCNTWNQDQKFCTSCGSALDPEEIQKNLIAQLTAPVRWTQTMKNMLRDGATSFIEVGPGNVLQGLIKKVDRSVEAAAAVPA